MKKRLLSVLLVTLMMLSMLSGCSKTETTDSNGTGSDKQVTDNNSGNETAQDTANDTTPKEIEKIKIYVPTGGKTDDIDKVMEEVNKISREKIGVEVEFKTFEFGQWFQQYSLFLSGTEDIDVLINYGGYLNAVSQGAAYELTDLLQDYGQDIIEQEGDFLKSGEIDGVQYAIPIYASYAWTMGIIYRKDVVEELGLTEQVANVKSIEEWSTILEAVKKAKPDMTPFVANNGNTAANFRYGLWDDLGNNYGVLMDAPNSSSVENLFETDKYAELCGVLRDWYMKGYSSKDIQTQTDGFTVLTKNDAAFSTLGQADFNTAYYQSTTCGKDMGVLFLGTPIARTYNNVTYTIMSNSEHPEASMKFLNLWFSDEEVGNLISYGIEGEHYVLNEAGMGSYPEGQNASNTTYHLGSAISNINRIRWETENPEYSMLLTMSNTTADKSIGLGFSFDTSNVTNEITQLDNVCSKYQIGLETGALDPETYLQEFNEALVEAGIETVIAEKQKQLDAFLKTSN